VLAIVATREGTSATIIDNTRDGFSAGAAWGQRLFFNQNGERASFTGTRMTEFVEAGGDATDRVDTMDAAQAKGLSCVMLIQVPLVQPQLARRSMPLACAAPMAYGESCRSADEAECDVDEAVIGHGEVEGPFTEIDNLAIKRDARFPIRVTVQFYKATSNGVISAAEMTALATGRIGLRRRQSSGQSRHRTRPRSVDRVGRCRQRQARAGRLVAAVLVDARTRDRQGARRSLTRARDPARQTAERQRARSCDPACVQGLTGHSRRVANVSLERNENETRVRYAGPHASRNLRITWSRGGLHPRDCHRARAARDQRVCRFARARMAHRVMIGP